MSSGTPELREDPLTSCRLTSATSIVSPTSTHNPA
eukprot:CAMPEP_0173224132 /NCGR_PEP_ID=MMETSP1142-20121109/4162_1 /TAXON_ID=483371 /ORGANISM="non described non described, Strain CCMP2298" /LENGTH=34 /DNA_ID= /DNA_START= /DNA_END= /DNA_ORIENTATION=